MSLLLDVKHLSYHTAGRTLVKQVDLTLNAGEILVVLGRNGAGKSTLLNLITGELRPSEGQIQIFGKPLSQHEARYLACKRAVLTQSTPLTFDYSVLDVVLLGRLPHPRTGNSARQDLDIAHTCLQQVGMDAFSTRGYLSLSGGEQQRVHLARVLAQLYPYNEEKIIFLDEPTSSLDLLYQHETLRILSELKLKNLGVFAIIHDLNLAAQYADRILMLKDGGVLAIGSPEQVLTQAHILAGFNYTAHVLRHPSKNCPLVV